MEESILNSLKRMIGIDPEDSAFDSDLIIHINTIFITLFQLGIGPNEVFRIEDANPVWSDFIQNGNDLMGCKTYMGLKLRMVFDPPTSSAVSEAFKSAIAEQEFRLMSQMETFRQMGGVSYNA